MVEATSLLVTLFGDIWDQFSNLIPEPFLLFLLSFALTLAVIVAVAVLFMQRVLKRKTEDRQKKPNDTESEVSQEPIATVEKVPTQQYEVGSFIESYPLIEPYAHAAIGLEPETKRIRYYLIEPSVTEEDMKIVKQLTDILAWELEVDVNALGSAADREKYLKGKILEAIMRYKIKVDQHVIDKLTYYLIRDFVYLGKIEPLLRDHLIEDVSCDGPHVPIFVWHRRHESTPTNVKFDSAEELDKFVARLAYSSGRHASIARPIIDGSLPDGSRVNLTFSSEVTKKGSTFTIRKFRADPLTITDLISFGTISAEAAAYLWYLVEHKASILIVGGVATGKTTFLNCTAMFIRPEFKIVSIEDTPELNFPHENWIQAVSRTGFGVATGAAEVSLFDLLKASLRQRPDFIIVGEIRGEEAYTLFQAVATGHGGLTTLHADSVFSAISRLENEPLNIPRPLIPNITALVLLNRVSLKEGPARRIINCTELSGIDESSGRLLFDNTFRWDVGKDVILPMGPSPYIKKLAGLLGLNEKDVKADLERRKVILEWMVKSNIRRYSEVSQVIREYYADHEKLYLKAVVGV